MMRRRAFLPALLALLLAVAMMGMGAKGLPSLHGTAHVGLAHLDAAIVAPDRAGHPRGQAEGREDGPGDGPPAAETAAPAAGPDAVPPVPRVAAAPSRRALAASARAPPLFA